jgi:hypothetical protein
MMKAIGQGQVVGCFEQDDELPFAIKTGAFIDYVTNCCFPKMILLHTVRCID